MTVLKYRELKHYKFQVMEFFEMELNQKFPDVTLIHNIPSELPFVRIENNVIKIRKWYAWDGASGAINTATFIRGSLVHDALYQLIREGCLDPKYRFEADNEMRSINIASGMSGLRAWYTYQAVRLFGGNAIKPEKKLRDLVIELE